MVRIYSYTVLIPPLIHRSLEIETIIAVNLGLLEEVGTLKENHQLELVEMREELERR